MYFSSLSKELQQAVKDLCKDQIFQDRFGHDEVLDKLDQEKFDPAKAFLQLQTIWSRKIFVGQSSFNAITPKIWSFLWILKSPLTKSQQPNQGDLDLLFWLLDNDLSGLSLQQILANSIGYVSKINLDLQTAKKIALTLIFTAFNALSMFPHTTKALVDTKQESRYDADWLTSLITSTHEATGKLPEQILNMSLCQCSYYFVQIARKNGVKNIQRQPEEQILKLQDLRCCELIAQRLVELGKIKDEDREAFIKQISTKPTK